MKTTLTAADGGVFEVEEAVAHEMVIVKAFIVESGFAGAIPLPNVDGRALSKIIQYLRKRLEFRAQLEKNEAEGHPPGSKEKNAVAEEIKDFETSFAKHLDNDLLKALIFAADYLDIDPLLELLKHTAVDRVKNESVASARKFFGVSSDYTMDEENSLRDQTLWAYESLEEDA